MTANIGGAAAPTQLGVPFQLILSRGQDGGDPTRALWRIGARFVLLDASGQPVARTVALTSPDLNGSGETDAATYDPGRGEEVVVGALLTAAQRTSARNFLATVEAALATALGVAPAAPTITSNGWQRPGR
jgi:hypothetical protein